MMQARSTGLVACLFPELLRFYAFLSRVSSLIRGGSKSQTSFPTGPSRVSRMIQTQARKYPFTAKFCVGSSESSPRANQKGERNYMGTVIVFV